MPHASAAAALEQKTARPGRFRWTICALLFLATAVNYADRQILGILAPVLRKEIGWSEAEYGLIVTAFSTAYAIGLVGIGRVIDVIGTRLGYALALACWSAATVVHGLVSSVFGFGAARFLLGLGEAGNFPAAVKTVAEWFPKRERALATGLFNSGSNVGAIVAPLLVPWITLRFGWRWAFAGLGASGFIWIAAWMRLYRDPEKHPKLSRVELEYIRSDPPEPAGTTPWRALIGDRRIWGLMLARFLTDPVWWFYLYWAPSFLNSRFGMRLETLGAAVAGMYLVANTGGVFGGWLSSWFIRRGRSNTTARQLAMLACAFMVVPIVLAPRVSNPWHAVGLISLAMAAHQGWAANIFTIVSDVLPRNAVSSAVGLCGFGGAVGGMLVASAVGFVLQATGSYLSIFAIASVMYLVGLSMIRLFGTRLRQRDA